MREAAAARRYERAAALRRRRARIEALLDRLEGVLRATHATPALVLARHPVTARHDAVWLARGRVADWGPLPPLDEVEARTAAALRPVEGHGVATWVPTEEIAEIRTVTGWLAAHPDTPRLPLDPPPTHDEVSRFLARAATTPPGS